MCNHIIFNQTFVILHKFFLKYFFSRCVCMKNVHETHSLCIYKYDQMVSFSHIRAALRVLIFFLSIVILHTYIFNNYLKKHVQDFLNWVRNFKFRMYSTFSKNFFQKKGIRGIIRVQIKFRFFSSIRKKNLFIFWTQNFHYQSFSAKIYLFDFHKYVWE